MNRIALIGVFAAAYLRTVNETATIWIRTCMRDRDQEEDH